MRGTVSNSSKGRKGQSTVELAVALLVFLPMVLGTMEFGRLVYTHTWTNYVCREATRWASVRGSASGSPVNSTQVTSFVRGMAIAINPNNVTVNTTWSPNNNPGSTVRVDVSYPTPGVFRWVFPAARTVRGISQMVIMQ
jgi:Flp pilus assembly protein TadG